VTKEKAANRIDCIWRPATARRCHRSPPVKSVCNEGINFAEGSATKAREAQQHEGTMLIYKGNHKRQGHEQKGRAR
jgi:hypothetical protein